MAACTATAAGTESSGATLSSLTVTLRAAEPPRDAAVHVSTFPAVSSVTVTGSQPFWLRIRESSSASFHSTLTGPVWKPLAPSLPVTTGVITGGVESTSRSTIEPLMTGPLVKWSPDMRRP